MLVRAILDNLTGFVVPAVARPAGLVPLAALAAPDMEEVASRPHEVLTASGDAPKLGRRA